MADINSVTITATVNHSAVIASTSNGSTYAHFGIEVDRSYVGRDGQLRNRRSFFNCTIYGRLAMRAQNELIDGARVVLQGEVAESRSKASSGEWVSTFGIEVKDWLILALPMLHYAPPQSPPTPYGGPAQSFTVSPPSKPQATPQSVEDTPF